MITRIAWLQEKLWNMLTFVSYAKIFHSVVLGVLFKMVQELSVYEARRWFCKGLRRSREHLWIHGILCQETVWVVNLNIFITSLEWVTKKLKNYSGLLTFILSEAENRNVKLWVGVVGSGEITWSSTVYCIFQTISCNSLPKSWGLLI